MRKTAGIIAAAGLALAACSSAPAAHTAARSRASARPLAAYIQPGPFTCTVTKGAVLSVRVPGDGLRARLSDVIVKYVVGNGQFEHVLDVTGGVVPAHGATITWDDRPGRIDRCKVVSYLP